jgi:hypothetical protein
MADDDDDWVGTPPEGHYTRDRAKPDYWYKQRAVQYAFAGLALAVVILLLVVLLA